MSAHILLVEDDTALREGLTELFAREGYAVESAASVSEARERLNGLTELVVLDVSLPDGDGVSLCRQWRASSSRSCF